METVYTIDDRLAYERAMKRFKDVKSFYINLTCYCIVVPTLIGVNLYFMPDQIWWYWSAIGWGIGVTLHGISAFGKGFYGTQWEANKMDEYLRSENFKNENQDSSVFRSQITSSNVQYLRVQKRVKALGGYYKHLTVYIIVNAFILAANYFDGERFWSFETWSTAIFWGIGLFFHTLGIFTENIFMGSDWEQRKIAEIMKSQSANYPERK